MEEAKRASTKFLAGASQCFLLGVTWYGKGTCIGTCMGWWLELVLEDWQGNTPLGVCLHWLIVRVHSWPFLELDITVRHEAPQSMGREKYDTLTVMLPVLLEWNYVNKTAIQSKYYRNMKSLAKVFSQLNHDKLHVIIL